MRSDPFTMPSPLRSPGNRLPQASGSPFPSARRDEAKVHNSDIGNIDHGDPHRFTKAREWLVRRRRGMTHHDEER